VCSGGAAAYPLSAPWAEAQDVVMDRGDESPVEAGGSSAKTDAQELLRPDAATAELPHPPPRMPRTWVLQVCHVLP